METFKEFLVEKKVFCICILLSIICLSLGFLYLKDVSAEESFHCPVTNNNVTENDDDDIETLLDIIQVDIKGAVKNPGVYVLDEGSVVNDLILAAGGLTKDADTTNLNLSKKLENEMVIIVYTKKEMEQNVEKNLTSDADISESLGKDSIIESDSNSTSNNTTSKPTKKVNLNTASLEELTTLPGIGEAKAKSIIQYRKTCGSFKVIEDLKNISGIGDSVYAKLEKYITV